MGRTIVIGDIHGCFDELQDLLRVVELRTDDRVIAVGDLIVKGPRNCDVLDRFIEDDRFSSVIGNHDRALRSTGEASPCGLVKSWRRRRQSSNPRGSISLNICARYPSPSILDLIWSCMLESVRVYH
jgi:predicted phosphodiesterase